MAHAQSPTARPRDADQRWKEAKLVTFYDPGNAHRYTAATTGNHQALGRLMRRHAAQLQLDQADRKYSVTDGAEWISNQYQQQLPMLESIRHRRAYGNRLPLSQLQTVDHLPAQTPMP
jgi:hypothetical protein